MFPLQWILLYGSKSLMRYIKDDGCVMNKLLEGITLHYLFTVSLNKKRNLLNCNKLRNFDAPFWMFFKFKENLLKNNVWRTSILFMGPLITLFWTSGDVYPGFQSLGGFICLHASSPTRNGNWYLPCNAKITIVVRCSIWEYGDTKVCIW